jgi:hypothetical protein
MVQENVLLLSEAAGQWDEESVSPIVQSTSFGMEELGRSSDVGKSVVFSFAQIDWLGTRDCVFADKKLNFRW